MALAVKDNKLASQAPGEELNHEQISEMVKALYDLGWNKKDIATHLKKDLFEIDIYLKD